MADTLEEHSVRHVVAGAGWGRFPGVTLADSLTPGYHRVAPLGPWRACFQGVRLAIIFSEKGRFQGRLLRSAVASAGCAIPLASE